MNKKQLKLIVKELQDSNRSYQAKLSLHIDTVSAFSKQVEALIEERNHWRIKFEQLSLTPEIKADTEAAFLRGQQMATNKFHAWFLTTAQKLNSVLQEPDEK